MHQGQARDPSVEAGLLHKPEQRHQDALVGDKHAKDYERHNHFPAWDAVLAEHIAVQRTHERRKQRSGDTQNKAVLQTRGKALPGNGIAFPVELGGKLPGGHKTDFCRGLQAGHNRHVNRNQVDDCQENGQELRQDADNASRFHNHTSFRKETTR